MTRRATQLWLVLALAIAGGMSTGCDDTSPANPPTPEVASISTSASTISADPTANPCLEINFTIDTVRGLQRGVIPADERETAQRIVAFAKSAPAELTAAAEGVTGPMIIAFKHPQAHGEVDTQEVNADLTTLEQWRSRHC